MKRFIFVLAFMAGCSRPMDTSGNSSPSNTSVNNTYWRVRNIGTSLYIITDPVNGQEYIGHFGGGITPRLK